MTSTAASSAAPATAASSVVTATDSTAYDSDSSTASAASSSATSLPPTPKKSQSRMLESVLTFTGVNEVTARAQHQFMLISQQRQQAALEREAKERAKRGTARGLIKREWRLRELNAAIEKGNAMLRAYYEEQQREEQRRNQQSQRWASKGTTTATVPATPIGTVSQWSEVETIPFPQLFTIGAEVKTGFGVGQVKSFRPKDGIYEIHTIPSSGSTIMVPVKMYISAIYVLPAGK